jgi:predicted AlkP superfamily pyrophosphatase or phosphodiesterase
MSSPRGSLLLIAVLALVGAGLAAYLVFSDAPIAEVVGLVAEGGEKTLREPMRPAAGGPCVLVIALDGVGDDELRAALRDGTAPNLRALVGAESGDPDLYEHAFAAPGVLSILPSTTMAAWSSVFSGEPPARTGVPGNEWFVREEMKFYAPAPVSVTGTEQAVEIYSDDLLGRAIRVPTIYERAGVRAYVSLSQVHRGADLLTMPDLGALGDVVGSVARGLTDESEVSYEIYAELDRTAAESLVTSIRDHGLPDLLVAYFPGVDLYTHVANDPINDQRNYVRDVVDQAVGAVLDEYRVRGALDSTFVVIVSDHGHTPVVNDDRHALGVEGAAEPVTLIEAAGFRVRPFELEIGGSDADFQATVAYQGAVAYLYLADRSTCAADGQICDWIRPPRFEEDVLPVVRAFDAANRTGAGVSGLQGTLDLIFARVPRPIGQDALPFQVWDGLRLVPIVDYLAEHPRPDLLDLERRLEGLAAGPYGHRAGDVLLLARSGMERPIDERFYFSGRYRSWHGSASAQDGLIPLVLARPGSSGTELRELLRAAVGDQPSQLDIMPLILNLLGAPDGPDTP